MSTNKLGALTKIEALWSSAIDSIDAGQYADIIKCLNARMPECLNRIADLVVADGMTAATRLRAAELLDRVLNHLMHAGTKTSEAEAVKARAAARRAQFEAKKHRAKTDEKELALKERKHQERKSKRLAEALSQVAEQTGETNGN